MDDFVTILVAAREKAGLTQAQAATAAGLTPSYLSFIENRKKPPPSDEVCLRLASVLGLSPSKLLEAAHLERTPETVRKRLRTLRTKVRRERRSRLRVLRALLSPFLFAGPQGLLEGALDQVSLSPTRRRRLRQALSAVGRHHQDRADAVANALEELPEREREVLLEVLPKLLGEKFDPPRAGRTAGAGRDSPAPPSSAGAGDEAGETAAGATVPALLYAAPAPGRARAPFLLEVDAALAAGSPEGLSPGDRVLVDPETEPRPGDLLLLGGGDEAARIRRLEEGADGRFVLVGRSEREDVGDSAGLAARLRRSGVGTVVEIRRPMRRPARGGVPPAPASRGTAARPAEGAGQ